MLTRQNQSHTNTSVTKEVQLLNREDNINKILLQTEGIDQIKADLKRLNDLAEQTKGDHDVFLDIQTKLPSYRQEKEKLSEEVKTNTKDIKGLKENITKFFFF